MKTGTHSEKLKKFFAKYPKKTFKKGEVILSPTDNPPGIFFLEKGLVSQYVISKSGDMLTIHMFRPNSFFMMMWAINQSANSYYFEALIDTEVYLAPLNETLEFVKSEPEILFDFTKRILRGLSGVLERLESLVLDPAYIKLASLLSYFARTVGEKSGDNIIINLSLTHQDIARWIGATRETTSLQLEALKKKKIISYNRESIVIRDIAGLHKETSN